MHLALLAAALLQNVDERLELFKASLDSCRGESEKIHAAFRHLCNLKDDRLRDEAIKYVRRGDGVVRSAACQVIREYPDDEKAADALVDALAAETDPQAGADLALTMAEICPDKHVKKYACLLTHPSPFVAAHAIAGSEKVRSVELIEPLIKLVAELEKVADLNALDYYAAKSAVPTTMQQRREACLEPARKALRELTSQNLTTGDEWVAWWKDNKKTFKIAEK